MEIPQRRGIIVFLLIISLIVAGIAIDRYQGGSPSTESQVVIRGDDGAVVAEVNVRVADSAHERYVGLSNTEELGPNEGMLFVHETEGEYAYVMRDMDFPIDIVFIGADQRITAIYHAAVEEPPLTRYNGRGKWVLEVSYHWTRENNVTVGMEADIQLAS